MAWSKEAWDEKLREVPPRKMRPEDWPKGIWHLKPVALEVKLRWYELTLATLATAATLVQAFAAVFKGG